MKLTPPLLLCVLSTLVIQGCSGATRPNTPCGAEHRAAFFNLDTGTRNELEKKSAYFSDNPPSYPEDKANDCCSFWNDSIAAFCQSKVDAFCISTNCSTPDERERCSRAERERVKEVCLQTALIEYRKLLPICAPLQLKELTTHWPNQKGEAVACPCAISACSYTSI